LAPVWSQNWPLRSSTQPVSFVFLPELAADPLVCAVLSPAGVEDCVEGVEACGVFLVSSVCAEPDVLGVVEPDVLGVDCANMVTEKHVAAANVSSFFMVFHLLG
jgi:hypothetical protein